MVVGRRGWLRVCVALLMAAPVLGYPAPRIPREQIPADAPPEVRVLIEKLYTADDAESARAAVALGEMGESAAAAAPFLGSMMHTKHPRGPKEAAAALKKMGKAAIEPCLLALHLSDHYARGNAIDVLCNIELDERAIDPLMADFADSNDGRIGDCLVRIGKPAFERVVAAVQDKEPIVRRRGVRALVLFGDEKALQLLEKARRDPAPEVRHAVLVTYANPPRRRGEGVISSRALPVALEALQDADPGIRREAARILVSLRGSEATDALVEAALRDAEPMVRVAAVEALSGLRNDKALAALSQLAGDKDESVRLTVIRQLGSTGMASAVGPLKAALRDPLPEIRERATASLGQIRTPEAREALLAAARDSDGLVRRAAVTALKEYGSADTLPLIVAALEDREDEVRLAAVAALAGRGASEELIKAFKNARPGVRAAAVTAAGEGAARSAAAMQAIPTLFTDAEAGVRLAALNAAARVRPLPSAAAVRPLLKDATPEVRASAARLIGALGDQESIPVLGQMIQSTSFDAEAAAGALAGMGKAALDPLLKGMNSRNANVRRLSAHGLARVFDEPQARAVLAAAIKDSDGWVRETAQQALRRAAQAAATPETLAEALRESDEPRLEWELARFAEKAVPLCQGLLKSRDPAVRWRAVGTLGRISSPAAVSLLASALQDADGAVRLRAAGALGQIGLPASVTALAGVLEGAAAPASVREAAAIALGRLADPAGARPLAAALKDGDFHVRLAAVEALGKLKYPSPPGPSPTRSPKKGPTTAPSGPPEIPAPGETGAAVIGVLRDEHWYLRRAAATTLAEMGERGAVPALITALGDAHWFVRCDAAAALEKLTKQNLGEDAAAWRAWVEGKRRGS